MVDLSKIDWEKCKLKPLPCLMASGSTKQFIVCVRWDEAHKNVVIYVDGYRVLAKTGHGSLGWQFLGLHAVSTTDDTLELIERAKEVNAFIAAETARIEVEENLVKVHWRDVEWLYDQGVTVFYSWPGETSRLQFGVVGKPSEGHRWDYNADQRTLPSGYDPEKPRLVEVERSQIVRLARLGCTPFIRGGVHGTNWSLVANPTGVEPYEYAIDIHTIPSGVPLHEEPKPVSRPCTKEFALKHPKESEARYTGKWYDSGWDKIDTFDFTCAENDYAFRTTASEEPAARPKSRIIASVPVTNIDMSRSGPGSQIFLRLKTDSPATYNQCVEFTCKPSEWATLVNSEQKLHIALIVDEES